MTGGDRSFVMLWAGIIVANCGASLGSQAFGMVIVLIALVSGPWYKEGKPEEAPPFTPPNVPGGGVGPLG